MEAFIRTNSLRCSLPTGLEDVAAISERVGAALQHGGVQFDRALLSGFDDGGEVVLVRDLDVRIEIDAGATEDDVGGAFGLALSTALNGAVDSRSIVRFPSRAVFAARMLTDLIGGHADRWFYRSVLTPEVGRDVRAAARRVLRLHADVLPAVLVELHTSGRLDAVLATLGVADHWALWVVGLRVAVDREQLREMLAELQHRPDSRGLTMSGNESMSDSGVHSRVEDPTLRAFAEQSGLADLDAEGWAEMLERVLGRVFDAGMAESNAESGAEAAAEARSAADTDAEPTTDEGPWREIEAGMEGLRTSLAEATDAIEDLGRELVRELERPVDAETRAELERWMKSVQEDSDTGDADSFEADGGTSEPESTNRSSDDQSQLGSGVDALLDKIFAAAIEKLDVVSGTSDEVASTAREDGGSPPSDEAALDRASTDAPKADPPGIERGDVTTSAQPRPDDGMRRERSETSSPATQDQGESLRPLFAVAFEILRRIGCSLDDTAREKVFPAWASRVAVPREWRDPVVLAQLVADAVRFWIEDRHAVFDRNAALCAIDRGGDAPDVFAGLDWLDVITLRRSVRKLVAPAAPPIADSTTDRTGLPPRLRRLERGLAEVMSSPELGLDPAAPVSAANAVRVYAALTAHDASWSNDPAIGTWIRRALARWARDHSLPADWMKAAASSARSLSPAASPDSVAAKPQHGFDTACAGLFLMMRAVADLRLHALLTESELANGAATAFITTVGLRLAGVERGTTNGSLDPGLSIWAGPEGPTDVRYLDAEFAQLDATRANALHVGLLARLRQTRLAGGGTLQVHDIATDSNRWLVCIDAESEVVCFATRVQDDRDPSTDIAAWEELATQAWGTRPELQIVDDLEFEARIVAMLEAVEAESAVELPHGATCVTALAALQLWARWLKGFESSSPAYLLEELVRRDGRVFTADDDDRIEVSLAAKPLDLVLENAGYFEPFDGLPWLPRGGVVFRRST